MLWNSRQAGSMGHLHIKSLFLVNKLSLNLLTCVSLDSVTEGRKERKKGRKVKACLEAKARCCIVPAYELGYFLIHMTETHFTLLR